MKRVLITGGFGFLGGRVAQDFASSRNVTIILGSRKFREPPEWLPNAHTVQTKWDSISNLTNICRDVDVIVHLAAMNAENAVLDPVGAHEFNVLATTRLIRAAKKCNVSHFIYLSTVHVYGNPLPERIDEETAPNPIGPYAMTHYAAEDAVLEAVREGVFSGIVLRLSNSFGAPTDPDVNCWQLLVNDLARQAVTTNRLILRSSGEQQRDFISISNVGRAITHFCKLNGDSTGIVNIGGQISCSVVEMASYVADCYFVAFGKRLHIDRKSSSEIHLPRLDFRNDKLLGTGFRLSMDQDEEMARLLQFCNTVFCKC